MSLHPSNDIFLVPHSALPARIKAAAPDLALTAVYSGRDIISRQLGPQATLGDLAAMLPACDGDHGGVLTYVRVVIG